MEDLLKNVISALQPTGVDVRSRDPLEIASGERMVHLEDVEKALLWGIERISLNPSLAWRAASLVTSLSVHLPSPLSSDSERVILLFDAMELSQNPTPRKVEEMIFMLRSQLRKVRSEIQREKRKVLVGSGSQSVAFLVDFFDNLAEELHSVCSVSKETAHRWMRGEGISPERREKIVFWAEVFYMLSEMGENPIYWWQNLLSEGKSPRDYFLRIGSLPRRSLFA